MEYTKQASSSKDKTRSKETKLVHHQSSDNECSTSGRSQDTMTFIEKGYLDGKIEIITNDTNTAENVRPGVTVATSEPFIGSPSSADKNYTREPSYK